MDKLANVLGALSMVLADSMREAMDATLDVTGETAATVTLERFRLRRIRSSSKSRAVPSAWSRMSDSEKAETALGADPGLTVGKLACALGRSHSGAVRLADRLERVLHGALAHLSQKDMDASPARPGRGGSILGVLLLLVSTLFAAPYVVVSSRTVVAFSASSLAAGQQMIGFLFATAVLSLIEALGLEHQDWPRILTSQWLHAACSGIVQYALAFWL